MKFSLTITDATLDEIKQFLGANQISATVPQPVYSETIQHIPAPIEQPSPPVAPVAQTPLSDEKDSTGLPWDERIHSANKGTNSDGTWRKRRGVDDATVSAVEAELRARSVQQQQPAPMFEQPAPPAAPVAQETIAEDVPDVFRQFMSNPAQIPTTPPIEQPAPVAQAPIEQPAPPAAPVAQAPIEQPAPMAAIVLSFPEFMQRVAAMLASKTIDHAYIADLQSKLGIPAITALGQDAAKLAQACSIMQADGKLA